MRDLKGGIVVARVLSRVALFSGLLASGNAIAQDAQQAEAPVLPQSRSEIIVTADRSIVAALRGIGTEREYDESDVSGYGISTVGEFVNEVMAENGDEDAVFLIDGEPVSGIDDVSDFPAEAIERLEVLPRGSGQMVGGPAGQRVYNVVLKSQLRSLAVTASHEVATEGSWGLAKGEAIASRIAGRERLNLTVRARHSDRLFEADRGLIQPAAANATRTADYYEPVDAGAFRTLRPGSTSYEASLIGGSPLAPGVTTAFSLVGRLGTDNASSGLPYLLFTLPAGNSYSPGGMAQSLVLFGPDALDSRSRRRSLSGNGTFNVSRGSWFATATAQFNLADQNYRNERVDNSLAQPITVPSARNPYTDPLDDFFVTRIARASSNNQTWSLKFNVGAPLLRLPAGMLRARAALERNDIRSGSRDQNAFAGAAERIYRRSSTRFDGGIDLPVASRSNGFLSPLGDLTLNLDIGRDSVDRFPDLHRSSANLIWQPSQNVHIGAFAGKAEELPDIQFLADPVVSYDNARVFDFLSGETVDVSLLVGGNPDLQPITRLTQRLSFSGALWPRYSLQLNVDYERNRVRNLIGAIPASSTSVYLAFPERFVRDAADRLVTVDSRPVNFNGERRSELRTALSFTVPLSPNVSASGDGNAAVSSFRQGSDKGPKMQITASYTYLLNDTIILRPTLAPVDLLDEGAIGIGGGRPRHLASGSVTYSEARFGVRLTGQYRSTSAMLVGTPAVPERIDFRSIFTQSLRVFAELAPLFPGVGAFKETRVALSINNLKGARQRVIDASGNTPLRYQPAYLDPIGRTLELELRKVF